MEKRVQSISFGGATFEYDTSEIKKATIERIDFRRGTITLACAFEDGTIGVDTFPLRLARSSDSGAD